MTDQVAFLNREPSHFQIGEPGAPCGGCSTCTDCVIAMIARHEKGMVIGAGHVRRLAAPGKDPSRGLNPTEALLGIRKLGITGYSILVGATASDAMRASDRGVVLVAVGYDGYPVVEEAEIGGRTDLRFAGPHATSLWGRRNWQRRPAKWPAGKAFKPGWRVWMRDPDHHFGSAVPPYDRFRSSFLVRAMDALVGNEGWQVRLAIGRFGRLVQPRALTAIEPHAFDQPRSLHDEDQALRLDLPDFGTGQTGGLAA